MITDDSAPKSFTLKRWSQRKLEATRAEPKTAPPEPGPAKAGVSPLPSPAPAHPPAPATADTPPALPPVESLTIDSDFKPFFDSRVDESLRRSALKQLFRDPHFNVMDGLDIYIDDYTKPDPIAPEIVRQLAQSRYIFDPPKTRVNDQGIVEDVPPEETAADAPAAESPEQASLPEGAPAPLPPAHVEGAAEGAPSSVGIGGEQAPDDGKGPVR